MRAGLPPTPELVTRTFRLKWVDTAKGFGIILVVLGHELRGLVNGDIVTWTPAIRFVDSWIYAFHMPLFFFLSGLFLFRSTAKPWTEFAGDKIRTIAYPYFVWSVITLMIKAALGRTVHQPYDLTDLPLIFYRPIDQFWFLYVLFILLLAISALLKFGVRPWVVFLLAILLYPELLPISSFGLGILNVTRMMAIYVALGVMLGSDQNIRLISDTQVCLLAAGVAAGLIVSSLAGWIELPYRNLFEPALAVSGIAAIVALALLTDKARVGATIQFLGRYSLAIYLVHGIASAGVRIMLIKFAHISAAAPHFVLGILAGLYMPILVVLIFERIGFQAGFAFPRHLT